MFDSSDASASRPAAPEVNHGVAELAIQLGDKFEQLDKANEQASGVPAMTIAGFMTRPLNIVPCGRVITIGLRFKAGGLAPFSGMACGEFANRLTDAEDIFHPYLFSQLLGAVQTRSVATALDGICGVLVEQAKRAGNARHLKIQQISQFMRQDIGTSVKHACEASNSTIRSMERHFRELVGVSPARFRGIRRFKRALAMLGEDTTLSWPSVAAEAGYSDQSHMCRDFRQISGLSPSAWRVPGAGPGDAPIAESPCIRLMAGSLAAVQCLPG